VGIVSQRHHQPQQQQGDQQKSSRDDALVQIRELTLQRDRLDDRDQVVLSHQLQHSHYHRRCGMLVDGVGRVGEERRGEERRGKNIRKDRSSGR